MKNNVNGWSIPTDALVIGLTALTVKTLVTTILFVVGLAAMVWYLYRQFLSHDTDNTHTLYEQLFINRE